jgi:dTDP-4-amino-4,6-dideoxygalactose transaminase
MDNNPVRRTIDPSQLETAITPNTKAIIPVHLYGQVADMQPILEIAAHQCIAVIKDAAQAYEKLLSDLPTTLPTRFNDSQSVWHCYVIESDRRDEIRSRLSAAGIETGLHYPVRALHEAHLI